jgi:Rrf2 family protein
MPRMRISARSDYAVRAALELAAAKGDSLVKAEAIASAQGIPHKFLEGILSQLRRAGIVASQRGGNGGFRLATPADVLTVADVIRAVDGPLVSVRGARPPELSYAGPAESLLPLWVAVRANVREILGEVTLADVAAGALPERVRSLTEHPEAWTNP